MLLLFALALSNPILWSEFKRDHKKEYTLEEDAKRYQIFKDNLKKIDEMNKMGGSAKFGITQFADLSTDEFKGMFIPQEPHKEFDTFEFKADPPKEVDWTKHTPQVVTAVRNQGQCVSALRRAGL